MRLLLGKWGNTKDRLISNLFQRATADGGVLGSSVACIDAAYSSADNSSLLTMVPAFGKAGKLYSIIPESGAGDFSVVRGTTASYVGQDGLIRFAANNEPRFDWTNGCPALLVEPAATNLLTYSNDFSNVAWSKVGAPTITSGQQSPTQTPNQGWIVGDNSVMLLEYILQVINKVNNTNSFQIFIKKTIGTPSFFPAIGIRYTGGSQNFAYYYINTTTGLANLLAASDAGSPSFECQDFGDFWRCKMQATDVGANPLLVAEIYPAGSFDGITPSDSAVGNQIVYGAMVGEGSYIPTVAATATRNADAITVTPPAGTSEIVTTFEDGTTQVVTSIPGTFTIPNGRVAKVKMT